MKNKKLSEWVKDFDTSDHLALKEAWTRVVLKEVSQLEDDNERLRAELE